LEAGVFVIRRQLGGFFQRGHSFFKPAGIDKRTTIPSENSRFGVGVEADNLFENWNGFIIPPDEAESPCILAQRVDIARVERNGRLGLGQRLLMLPL
jgi:hypothetical protein